MLKRLACLPICALAPLGAAAQEMEACAFDYEVFEAAVPHNDMDACPEALQAEGAFCRMTLLHEVATVFVFSEETTCLERAQSYQHGEYEFEIED